MKELNELLSEIGISKVKLDKVLGIQPHLEIYNFCKNLRDKELSYKNSDVKLHQIALAARWAELLLRDNNLN